MFPSFTGNSRRPRNVNLSGQRSTNPWANSGWSAAPQGASQTVAQATAEREKRRRERDELTAAKRLQKTWRGYKGRQDAKAGHRQTWDGLYGKQAMPVPDRLTKALPLLLALFDASKPEDQQRLDQFVRDIASPEAAITKSGLIHTAQWTKLAPLLVAALER